MRKIYEDERLVQVNIAEGWYWLRRVFCTMPIQVVLVWFLVREPEPDFQWLLSVPFLLLAGLQFLGLWWAWGCIWEARRLRRVISSDE